MENFVNKGVDCNVTECIYNEKGCNCNRSKIEVSVGDSGPMPSGEMPHFCKSYICKNNFGKE